LDSPGIVGAFLDPRIDGLLEGLVLHLHDLELTRGLGANVQTRGLEHIRREDGFALGEFLVGGEGHLIGGGEQCDKQGWKVAAVYGEVLVDDPQLKPHRAGVNPKWPAHAR